jgi:hypothetical protein
MPPEGPSKAQKDLQKILEMSERIDPWWHPKTPKNIKEVKRFSNFWSRLVQTSNKYNAAYCTDQRAEVEATVQTIFQWEAENTKLDFSNCNFPTTNGTDKAAVDPILSALIHALKIFKMLAIMMQRQVPP